jgi:hypothetical protein
VAFYFSDFDFDFDCLGGGRRGKHGQALEPSSLNPNGIPDHSPGLRQRRYPGATDEHIPNPNGVASKYGRAMEMIRSPVGAKKPIFAFNLTAMFQNAPF